MKPLLDKLPHGFDTSLPASLSAIEAAEKLFNLMLPADYKAFLQFTNGLEGDGTDNYLVLWSAEELVQLNQAYNVSEFVSGVIIIGSDGAEDAFAFDTTNMSIIKLPFIGMGYLPSEKLADSFEEFLTSQIIKRKGFFNRIFN